MSKRKTKRRSYELIVLAVVAVAALIQFVIQQEPAAQTPPVSSVADVSGIPEYAGEPYVALNGNVPDFGEIDPGQAPYETYRELDDLGRCTLAMACVDESLMPTEDRGSISSVKPSGWQSVSYDFVDGGSLYNRCHLIGFQLTGENANERNLITGTRYMNVEGMLPFENLVADYIKETGNRVLYRVTPVFEGDELVARGVQMEACSIEDGGEGVCFNVYCYNVQPGVEINYATGDSSAAEFTCDHDLQSYILNTSSEKFHDPDCSGARNISPENREEFTGCAEELLAKGYKACGSCDPEVP